MGLTIKNTPFYRYSYNTRFSIQLLESYINTVEEQIKISKENYRNKKETIITNEDLEMGTAQIVEIHNRIDSQTWDLDEIFLEHFPNIQRKSALLTLYSFFEDELIQLCFLFKKAETFNLGLKDISGKGIISKAIIYLEKVACLKIKDWTKIHDIRKIRNLIVHNNGRLIDNDGKQIKEMRIVKTSQLLSGETELIIGEGYLQDVLLKFRTQFEVIDREIKLKYPDNKSTVLAP